MNLQTIQKKLLPIVLLMLGFMVAWLWWVPMRCMMDGNVFQWGNSFGFASLRGNGMMGDFPILVLLSSYIISMIFLGWRGARLPFHIMLVVWCVVEFATATVSAIQNPDAYRFRGDSFGIDISLALVGPTIWALLLTISVIWVITNCVSKQNEKKTPRWNRTNSTILIVAALFLPVQFLLFQSGEQHGLTDRIALILTIIQWILINFAMMPWNGRQQNTALSPA